MSENNQQEQKMWQDVYHRIQELELKVFTPRSKTQVCGCVCWCKEKHCFQAEGHQPPPSEVEVAIKRMVKLQYPCFDDKGNDKIFEDDIRRLVQLVRAEKRK